MQIIGVDFTSAPGAAKPLTLARCRFENGALICTGVERLADFAGLEAALAAPGPWIMGADFPFALAEGLAPALGWPAAWPEFADHLARLGRAGYEAALTAHRRAAPEGQKHLPRGVDRRTGGAAPNNIVNPPVGKMLFEGVTRLRAAGVAVPGLAPGDPTRRVVEAYPAVAVAGLIGKAPYKDGPPPEAAARLARRRALLAALAGDAGRARFGFATHAPEALADDPRGDDVDALLCAVQAGWAQLSGLASTAPTGPEGWIADPAAFTPQRPPAPPPDASARRAAPPVLCYPPEILKSAFIRAKPAHFMAPM